MLDYISLLLFFVSSHLQFEMFPDGIAVSLVLGRGCTPGCSEAPGGAGTAGEGSLLSPPAWAWGVSGFFLLFATCC